MQAKPMETWASFKVAGQRLHGMLHIPETPKPVNGYPALLILHGFIGSRATDHRMLVQLSRYLMQLGIASLRFDFRGCGESEGEDSEMTPTRLQADVQEAWAYLARQPEIDDQRLMLHGFSMGGMLAALQATQLSPKPHKLLLWAPCLPETLLKHMPGGYMPPVIVDIQGYGIGRAFFRELPTLEPLRSIKSYAGDVLVLHGNEDQTVAYQIGQKYAQSSPKGTFVPIFGASHVFDSHPWTEQLLRISGEFLSR